MTQPRGECAAGRHASRPRCDDGGRTTACTWTTTSHGDGTTATSCSSARARASLQRRHPHSPSSSSTASSPFLSLSLPLQLSSLAAGPLEPPPVWVACSAPGAICCRMAEAEPPVWVARSPPGAGTRERISRLVPLLTACRSSLFYFCAPERPSLSSPFFLCTARLGQCSLAAEPLKPPPVWVACSAPGDQRDTAGPTRAGVRRALGIIGPAG